MKQELSEALFSLFASIEPLIKNSENPYFKAKYADLGAVLNIIKGKVKDHGFFLYQTVEKIEGESALVTFLVWTKTGEEIRTTYPVVAIKTDPQAYGSAVTYARRYALQNLFGLNAEDDDAEKACGKEKKLLTKKELSELIFSAESIEKLKSLWTQNMASINRLKQDDLNEVESLKNTVRHDLQKT